MNLRDALTTAVQDLIESHKADWMCGEGYPEHAKALLLDERETRVSRLIACIPDDITAASDA